MTGLKPLSFLRMVDANLKFGNKTVVMKLEMPDNVFGYSRHVQKYRKMTILSFRNT